MLFLPFLSALVYPFGSLWTKQAQELGARPWRIAFIGNVIIAACFMPLLITMPEWPNWQLVQWPIFAGFCFFGGQFFTVMALKDGDVSVVAPLMGCKTLFVALYSSLGGIETLGAILWLAAFLTAAAVYLLGSQPRRPGKTDFKISAHWKSIGFALMSAGFFAAVDTTVGAQGMNFGPVWMLVCAMFTFALLSLLILPLARMETPAPQATKSIIGANISFGIQATILNIANALVARPTAVNIIYSSRGLTGIFAVWFIGHWFGNREREEVPKDVMIRRFLGALLLMAAIVIVVAN